MGCYKIDKLDKIVISFTLIIVTIFCIFNSFCFANENVAIFEANDFYANSDNNKISFTENSKGYYFEVKKGNDYIIKFDNVANTGETIRFCLTKTQPDIGVPYSDFVSLPGNTKEYKFTPNTDGYLYVFIYRYSNFDIFVDVQKNFTYVINSMVDTVGISQIWSIFENSISYILIVVLIALGFWFIKHNIIEHSKGREY